MREEVKGIYYITEKRIHIQKRLNAFLTHIFDFLSRTKYI